LRPVKIAPSLLSADPMHFAAELSSVESAGADLHHIDVMDGHFVPNLTYGLPLITALKNSCKIPLDVHVMITNPDEVAEEYLRAGADIFSFHVEAARHHHRLLTMIRSQGKRAGIAINPGTSLASLSSLLPYLDQVNIMSVNPGFSGQQFIPEAIARVRTVASMLKDIGRQAEVDIQVDGGVNGANAKELIRAGASILVAGHFIYKAEDRAMAVKSLRGS
jgi:ribulose-phosphate 3-epimerase